VSKAILNGFNANRFQEIEQDIDKARRGKLAEYQCRMLVGHIQKFTNYVDNYWLEIPQEERKLRN
jgi:hypothetical protein